MTRLALVALLGTALSSVVVAGCAAEAIEAAPPGERAESAQTANANGRVGSHGMVAFGKDANDVYLSHIPMFQAPHDVQLVAHGSFVGTGLPRTLGDRLYTFVPARMSLDALRLGSL